MYQNIVDLHVHTDKSFDGQDKIMPLCSRAESLRLRAVAFCDHCEFDVFHEWNYDRLVPLSYREMTGAQTAFKGKILILKGIELGQPQCNAALAEKVINTWQYDIILGSIHHLDGGLEISDLHGLSMDSADDYFRRYLDDIIAMIEWGHIDVLAHLTYPLRYFFSKSGLTLNLEKHKARTDEVLKLLIEKDMALEVNSAGLRMPIRKLSPEFGLVKRFRELGGKYVTFGSDAHCVRDVCTGLEEAYEVIRAAGFDKLTLFRERSPLQLPIE